MSITIKTGADIDAMRKACRLASEVLDYLTPFIKPGITTNEIDKLSLDYMVNVQGTKSATIGYAPPGHIPYPASLCTSVNHVVCHGIPNDKPLKKGDIVNVDVTVITKDGWYGDNSRMYLIGECSIAAKRLSAITYDAMWLGIQQVRPGAHLGDIGHGYRNIVAVRHDDAFYRCDISHLARCANQVLFAIFFDIASPHAVVVLLQRLHQVIKRQLVRQ